jgi:hypothetical protein
VRNATLSLGVATCVVNALTATDHSIAALYNGSPDFQISTGTMTQSVTRAGTHTIIGSSNPVSHAGQGVTFSAYVFSGTPEGGIPTGQFQFSIDGAKYGAPVSLRADGRAFLTGISELAVGPHRIGGKYLGDANHRPSKPVRLFQLVLGGTPPH